MSLLFDIYKEKNWSDCEKDEYFKFSLTEDFNLNAATSKCSSK